MTTETQERAKALAEFHASLDYMRMIPIIINNVTFALDQYRDHQIARNKAKMNQDYLEFLKQIEDKRK